MADGDEKLITERKVDEVLAAHISDQVSLTRTALNNVLPKTQGVIAQAAQYTRQRPDSTWLNPVRDASVGGRIYVGTVDDRPPAYNDGLQVGDLWVSQSGIRIAQLVPSAGSAVWRAVAGGGGGGTTPVDPGPVDPGPGTPADQSAPSPTVRPFALLATEGTWTTTGGSTLVQALSDQHISGATGAPTSGTTGVMVHADMGNFQHTAGHDLNVTLWSVGTTLTSDVTVSIVHQGNQYVAPITKQLVAGPVSVVEFIWPADVQLSLPLAQWKDVEVIVRKARGDMTILDLTLQSLPPKEAPSPGTDPSDAAALLWAPSSVWYSDLRAAPLARANAAVNAYVRSQAPSGALRLDAYGDAAPIWMVPGNTPRLNVTPPATSPRGAVTLMHTSDGKGALDGVPLPATMPAPANTFGTAVVGCVETKQLWELLGLTKSGTTWSASWGGRIDNYPGSGGAFPAQTGYTGSGLSWAAAAVKISEARDANAGNAQAIQHALGINLAYGTASNQFVWPATRSDGTSSDPGAPKMGQRLRLKASADLSQCTPIGRAVGEAMKRYGVVVMGGAERISILAESGMREQATTGVDPWGALLGGKSVDTILAGIPLADLEAVSPGWGGPNWTEETTVVTPVPDPTTPPATGTNRRAIYINPGVKWLSGASCRGIEKGSEGMGSAFATWRGEPCYMARCWADEGGSNSTNDPNIASLSVMYSNWHASMDVGNGFFGKPASGQTMAGAARGDYAGTWTAQLQTYRRWWMSRRDPAKVNPFLSPAHELNGSWYPWSVNSSNYTLFIQAWKRFRELQLKHFPEALLCLNFNRDSSFYSGTVNSAGKGMDWRRMVPGWAEGAASVKQWIDVGGVDYYNMDPNAGTAAQWAEHIMQYDSWGGPKGLERHRQFWEQCGLPMQIPEWSNNKKQGDSPAYAVGMNNFMRQHAGTGPGKIVADALFNLTGEGGGTYYDGEYAVMGDKVGSPNFAAKYRELQWGY